MRRSRVVAGLLASLALGAVVVAFAITMGDDGRTYEPAEVSAALNAEGLNVMEVGRANGNAALLPADGSFTVLVLRSDQSAREAFKQYETDTDPDTFELRAGNVIILADFSNSATPLPAATRARIGRAVDTLSGR